MYEADRNHVYYRHPAGRRLIFLTVHPLNGSDATVEKQAELLADILNARGAQQQKQQQRAFR